MFTRTLSDATNATLALLGNSKLLDFAYMAGGSALALQLGHRQSIDFDFFSPQKFDMEKIKVEMANLGTFNVDTESEQTIVGNFMGIKWSLFYLKYPLITDSIDYLGIRLASSKDIAAMKLAAILGRATKKDYIDIYFIIKKLYQMVEVAGFYEQKYQNFASNSVAIAVAIQNFEEAEKSDMPLLFDKVEWTEVKNFLRLEAKKFWEE